MIKCIKLRTWFIIIVLIVVAMFLILTVLANENEPEQREFSGTFVKECLNNNFRFF